MVDDMEVVLERNVRAAIDAILENLPEDDRLRSEGARVIYLVPGEQVVDDLAGDCTGQLTARLANMTAHRTAGTRPARMNPCSIDYWMATIEIRLSRCAATVNNQGQAPSAELLSRDGFQGAADMARILEALVVLPFVDDVPVWTPFGPLGGRSATTWTFTMKLDSPPCDEA